MEGTLILVKLNTHIPPENYKKIGESFRENMKDFLDPVKDKIVFYNGDIDIKVYNGKFIELTQEERDELIKKLLSC